MQCLIYICELMEHCEVTKFFNAVSESSLTLEAILRCCVLDEHVIKGLQGSSELLVLDGFCIVVFILHITIDTQSINSNSSCHFFFRYLLLIE